MAPTTSISTMTTSTYTLTDPSSTTGPIPGTKTVTVTQSYMDDGRTYLGVIKEVLVTLAPGCSSKRVLGEPLRANPDIAGLGFILGFTISAYVVLLWSLFAYRFGLIPSDLLKAADRQCFYANSRRVNTRWQQALETAAITFSDQQIITGISILLAAYVGLVPSSVTGQHTLSVYHWQIATYLAWMSSNVHLTTLSFLRDWLRRNRALYVCRIIGMTILLILLLSALLPTMSIQWSEATADPNRFGTPASCFMGYADQVDDNTPLSIAFLSVSYMWKIGQLHDASRVKFRKWVRSTPEWALEKLALTVLPASRKPAIWQRGIYRAVLILYVPFVAACELAESFAASLWLVTLGLIWGSLHIFPLRNDAPQDVRVQEESVWGFGQILPLLFLLQPATTLFEHFYSARQEGGQEQSDSEDPELHTLDGSRMSTSDSTTQNAQTLSSIFLTRGIRPPAVKAESEGLEPQVKFLYSSRLFRSIMWITQLFVLGIALWLFTSQVLYGYEYVEYAYIGVSSNAHNILLGQGGIAESVLAASTGLIAFLLFVVFIGSFFSKAFK